MTQRRAPVADFRAERTAGEVPSPDITLMACDLALLASRASFGAALLAGYKARDLVISSAGIMATSLMRNEDGFELKLGLCRLDHFLLMKLLARP